MEIHEYLFQEACVTEIIFLKPTYNSTAFQKFAESNNWCKDFYPNKQKLVYAEEVDGSGFMKRVLEKALKNSIGEKLDGFFFRLTLKRWKKKFAHFNETEFDLNLRSRKNVSKHHPRGYQKIVLESFQQKINNFEMLYNVKLH